MNKVIIFGSDGQDGRCLNELLVKRGVEVIGITRSSGIDIVDPSVIENLITKNKPDEIYYLAAFHHSSEQKMGTEFILWNQSVKTHLTAPSVILESIRLHHPVTKFFYAASSLVFGAGDGVLSEVSPFAPDSPYAITKAAGVALCQYYREKYGIFAAVGILFNHESEFRAPQFLSKKIARGVATIQKDSSARLKLGDLSAQVDWGYARDYVDAMTRILKLKKAENFIISSGKLHSVKELVELAFSKAGLDYTQYVDEDSSLLQRKIPPRFGNFSKLKEMTGWTPTTSFDKLIEILLKSEGVNLV